MAIYLLNQSFQRLKTGAHLWLVAAVLMVSSASGQDLDQDNDGIPDTYEKGLGNLTFGDAFNIQGEDNSAIAINDEEVQLTQDQRSLRGSAMSYGMIDLMNNFSFTIEAYFGVNRNQDLFSSSGADGIAIVFHNDPSGSFAMGTDGEGIGAQGIRNGIVLEIDTYGNGDTGATDPMRGAADNHTDIWDSDDVNRVSLIGGYRLFKAGEESPLEDGSYHEVIFTWIAISGTLSFTVDGEAAGELSLGSAESFINTYFAGSSAVYFGFTASTGAARNEHKVRIVNMESLPVVMDTDNDGIYDHLDLDSDNDGIYDAEEAGHGAYHVNGVVGGDDENGDGIPDAVQAGVEKGEIAYELDDMDEDGIYNHQDLDSDGDGCNDVSEMGFADDDKDGVLGAGIPTVDGNGVVVGVSGYTSLNLSFLDPEISSCQLGTDLGDDGDGDDVYVIFYEDSTPLDLMNNPRILNMDNGTGSITVEFTGVRDVNHEIIRIGDLEIALNDVSQNYALVFDGVSLEVTWEAFELNLTGIDQAGISVNLMESFLDQMTYQHTDTLMPTPGERTLSITVNDGISESVGNWVTIQVMPINDLPYADPDTVTLNELNVMEFTVLGGDVDWDGEIEASSVEIITNTVQGDVTVNTTGRVTYTPEATATQYDSFVYTVRDNDGGRSNEATVIILIGTESQEENNAPTATDDFAETTIDTPLQILVDQGLLVNDSDQDNDELEVLEFLIEGEIYPVGTMVSIPEGILIIASDGSYSFTPIPGFAGAVPPITYVVSDGDLTDTGVLQINVIDDNQSPIASDTNVVVTNLDGISFSLHLLGLDPDGDLLTFELLDNSISNVPGDLTLFHNGEFTFIPRPGFIGVLSLTYQVCDNQNPPLCDEGLITITVNEMDSDEDGIWDHEEDADQDQNLANDDCDGDGLANYLDGDPCDSGLIMSSVVSNNGDQLNPYLSIIGIEHYVGNKVAIFNRWGNKVWEIYGYDNSLNNRRFSGIGTTGTLPDGTYFYVVNKGDNSPVIKGFITLKNH